MTNDRHEFHEFTLKKTNLNAEAPRTKSHKRKLMSKAKGFGIWDLITLG
jgi:hypothetical protein